MFIATPVAEQIACVQQDRLRVLIVGAGVAGLTLAQALRADGLHPVLIERAADHADTGYMLALMPMVDPMLRQLGVREQYRARSVEFGRYVAHGRHGQLLREYAIEALMSHYGDYRGITRGELMRVLASRGSAVSYSTTLQSMSQTYGAAHVFLRDVDRTHASDFDAVVVADGLHSATRERLLLQEQVEIYDSGWGGWVAWMDNDAEHADRGDEVWGTDFFLGIYPVKGRAGVILGCHRDEQPKGARAFVAHVRRQLRGHHAWFEHALAAVESEGHPYYWKFTDCRSAQWAIGRAALLGDAAAGFLPTAGIGAGMAMESAGVLARRLVSSDRANVAAALRDYERAQRPRVEAAQANSRSLAKMMFRRSRVAAWLRDLIAPMLSLEVALRPVRKLLDDLPE